MTRVDGRCAPRRLMLPVAVAALLGTGCFPVGPQGPDASGRSCETVAAAGEWKTERSYTRGFVPRGDHIELGLEGRAAASVRAVVKAPDGSELSSTKTQEQGRGGSVHYVARYPRDFAPSGAVGALGIATAGSYTVRWEASGALAACDTFEVSRTGVADAEPCAPGGWRATAPFGSGSLSMRSGTATMNLGGDRRTLGVVEDPWYAFEANESVPLALADGSTATLRLSRSAKPRRVATQFRAGDVPYRFDATADAVADLVELSRAVVLCAQQRLAGNAAAPTPSCGLRPGAPSPSTDPRPTVFPPMTTLRVGESQHFVAAHSGGGCFGAPSAVTWSVSPPTLGTITPDGVFTAREAGTGTVTATRSAFTGAASVRVDR